MAQARTPDQLASALGDANAIADPTARLSALRALEAETLQGETAANNMSAVDKAIAAAVGGEGVTQPAAYTSLLASIRQSAGEANAAAQKSAPGAVPASMTQPAAPGSLDATKLQAQLDEASGKAENANEQLLLEKGRAKLAEATAAWTQKIQEAQLQGRDTQLLINQAKLDLSQQAQAARDQATAAKNQLALDKQDQTALTTLSGQEATQANTRATAASATLGNALQTGLEVAKNGGNVKGLLSGILGVAPGFQASMGGAPVDFTADHFAQLRALLASGKVPPDANGNVVPNGLKMLAAGAGALPGPGSADYQGNSLGGLTPPTGPTFSAPGAGNPMDVATQAAQVQPGADLPPWMRGPQFTAPLAA
jgi:hypothetical protein